MSFTAVLAQTYTTPNTGVDWTLADIAAASAQTISVSGDEYTLLENLVISENDKLRIDTDATVLFEQDILITVFGEFDVTATDTQFLALDASVPYEGFRFEEFSVINIQNATIKNGGGLRVLTEDFTINNSIISENVEGGATTSAVISLSRGEPQITNNQITFNELPAIGSAANSEVSATISGNNIEGNNSSDSNRPQINMGTTSATVPLQIIDNTIIGDPAYMQVGGISISNFVGGSINAIISGNLIKDNRYGITILGGNATVEISQNVIEDNNIQDNPGIGGSGININSTTNDLEITVFLNEIRRNLWGITLQDQSSINLGDDMGNIGGNTFSENGNNDVLYALFNNTPNTISALHNCWIEDGDVTLEDAELVIFHEVDDTSLGEVLFDPVSCDVAGVNESLLQSISLYPNPATQAINITSEKTIDTISIINANGAVVLEKEITATNAQIDFNLPSGLYFVVLKSNDAEAVKKLIVQ
ncbi:hypothetical protein SCB49_03334 [unidentified eubacterium SCB49]|nr:hypothetical protein SCB49_03334 [unidentified eubacterium SCB49]